LSLNICNNQSPPIDYNLACMIRFPNAKINIGLQITRKRPDGYHDLETIFYPCVELRDVLEIVPTQSNSGISQFIPSGIPIAGDARTNLVWRAYELLQKECPGKIPALDIYLHKAIPMGAGLGGGSADASFLLRMLNEYSSLDLSDQRLEVLALELGSDCPFFIRNSPQYARGRGEVMEPTALDLSAYRIDIRYPQVHVSTSAAFSRVVPKAPFFNLRQLPQLPIEAWKDQVHNDFETSVFAQFPEIGRLKESMYEEGAIYSSMSGSGSAVYGIFRK